MIYISLPLQSVLPPKGLQKRVYGMGGEGRLLGVTDMSAPDPATFHHGHRGENPEKGF